ncbi:DUF7322 domain-containing protein [Salinigranum halophilum]|uniref:DUF7322 domain-containing protein n=1 Tax=Salinigranum halophilum TaxID=2565931 RepID=UPI0010A7C17D|nr:hypothetical protein [Salinigranum halophilum]
MDDDWFDDSESLYPEGMDGPRVKTPSVDVPSATGDVFQRSEIARLFVLHVFVWNAVVLFVSLGAMLIYFRNDWTTGGRLLVAGGILSLYGLYRWPRADEADDESEDGEADGESESAGADAGDPPVEEDATVES